MCQTPDQTKQTSPPLGKTLTVLGGDARQIYTATHLMQAGYDIRAMGLSHPLPSRIKSCKTLTHALEGSCMVLLPLPATRDGQHIYCPLDAAQAIPLETLKAHLAHIPSVHIFGGRIPQAWRDELVSVGCHVTDYYDREDLQIKNARITAEGAVMTAMELTDRAILGMSVAVLGYGRIGQYLSRLLVAWGAKVTVYARRSESLAQAASDGCDTCHISHLSNLTQGYGVIFNTIPTRLIGKEILSLMPCDTLMIDLASPPFGIDPDAAGEMTTRCGLGVVFAPSLPGRYAPRDAGIVIAQSILTSLAEGGV